MQSAPITAHGEVYLIQHYVMMFVSYMWQVGGFSAGTLVSSTNETDSHDIIKILLKVAINTIPPPSNNKIIYR